jgi:long-chain fatty acid transport protein
MARALLGVRRRKAYQVNNHNDTRTCSNHVFPVQIALLLVAGQNLLAGGFQLPDQDAFATARGEAFVATADNASAIYYNPAGIGQLRGHNLRGGLYSIWYQSSYDDAGGQNRKSKGSVHPVPQLFYAYGCETIPFSFGLGVYSPYGLSQEWPQDVPFRQAAIKGSLTYLTVNPTVAWRVTPALSIAAGLTVNRGEADLSQGLMPSPVPGDVFRFKGDGVDVGVNLGLLWQVSSNVSVGASYRGPTTIKMKGTAELPIFAPEGAAETSFPFPQNLVGGVSWRPTPKWNLEVDVEWTDWNRVNALTVTSTYLPPASTVLNWESSYYYEFGVTRYFENGWHVSAGYVFNQNSMPDANYNPLIADLDKHFVSAGAGYQAARWSFDLAYQFGYGPDRNVQAGTVADGRYSFVSHALSASVGYKF